MKLRGLGSAFDCAADAPLCELTAYVSRSTGQTFLQSEWDDDEELPEELEKSDGATQFESAGSCAARRVRHCAALAFSSASGRDASHDS